MSTAEKKMAAIEATASTSSNLTVTSTTRTADPVESVADQLAPDSALPPTAFTSDDVFLLSSLANASTSVLRNAQLYEETVSRSRQTEALLHIIDLMSTDLGSSTIIPRIIDSAYKLVSCDRITLFLVQEMLHGASDKKDLLVAAQAAAQGMETMNVSDTPTPVADSRDQTPLPSSGTSVLRQGQRQTFRTTTTRA
jgi:GAF domain-containing protein